MSDELDPSEMADLLAAAAAFRGTRGMGVPRCAVCKKPVDRMRTIPDSARRQFVFVVECHGETQTVTMTGEEVEARRLAGFGEAFSSPLLAKPVPLLPGGSDA